MYYRKIFKSADTDAAADRGAKACCLFFGIGGDYQRFLPSVVKLTGATMTPINS
jgi:hypothetical protein